MKEQNLLQKLLELNDLESIGKIYYQTYNQNIDYSQCILFLRHPGIMTSVESLQSAFAIAEREKIKHDFHISYGQSGLTEEDFIKSERNIQIEKLLRYVAVPAHSHSFLECVYVITGSCLHTINENIYEQKTGNFTIIPPGTKHELQANPNCLCLTLKVRTNVFVNFQLPNLPLFSLPLHFNCGDDSFISNLLLNIYSQQEQEACYHTEIISLLFQTAITYCIQNYQDTMQFLNPVIPISRKLLEITNYAFENYQTITLRGMAQHFHYSESYLCRLFRENFDKSFTQMIKAYRLTRAADLLQTTNMKLDKICEYIGYQDTTQFIRDFKKQYQITPAKYGKQFRENK